MITGYKDLFKNPTTRNYRDGTTIEDIYALYQFDERLRELTLHHLLHIERHLRSVLSYAFCTFFGEHQSAYLDPENKEMTRRSESMLDRIRKMHNFSILNIDFLVDKAKIHGIIETNRKKIPVMLQGTRWSL